MRISEYVGAVLVAAFMFVVTGCGTASAAFGPRTTVVTGDGPNAGLLQPAIDAGAYAQRVDANNRAALTGAEVAHGNVQNASEAVLTGVAKICADKIAAGAVKADPVLTCICTNALHGAEVRAQLRIVRTSVDKPVEPGDYAEATEQAEAIAAATGSYRGGYVVYSQCGSITGQQRTLDRLQAEVEKSRRNEHRLGAAVDKLAAAAQKRGRK